MYIVAIHVIKTIGEIILNNYFGGSNSYNATAVNHAHFTDERNIRHLKYMY